jgi:signal transduction histidine kinase
MPNTTSEHSFRYATSAATTLSPDQRVHLHSINNQISVISLTASLMRQNAAAQGTPMLRAHIDRIAHAAEVLDELVQEYLAAAIRQARG